MPLLEPDSIPVPETPDQRISFNVRSLLWALKRSQRRLAQESGIDESLLSKKLRGSVSWTASDVDAAARALGVAPGVLYQDPGRPAASART